MSAAPPVTPAEDREATSSPDYPPPTPEDLERARQERLAYTLEMRERLERVSRESAERYARLRRERLESERTQHNTRQPVHHSTSAPVLDAAPVRRPAGPGPELKTDAAGQEEVSDGAEPMQPGDASQPVSNASTAEDNSLSDTEPESDDSGPGLNSDDGGIEIRRPSTPKHPAPNESIYPREVGDILSLAPGLETEFPDFFRMGSLFLPGLWWDGKRHISRNCALVELAEYCQREEIPYPKLLDELVAELGDSEFADQPPEGPHED